MSHETSESAPPQAAAKGKGKGKGRGRPRKNYPRLDGETDKAYAIRIAKLRKQPVTFFPDDDSEPVSDKTPAPGKAVVDKAKAKFRARARGARAQSGTRSTASEGFSDATSTASEPRIGGKKSLKSGLLLRDWRDVLGAAALAGFSAPALDRAARRCADLFGQSFSLLTLQEGLPDQDKAKEHMRYDPGMIVPSILEEDYENSGDDADEEEPSQLQRPPLRMLKPTPTAASEDERFNHGRSASTAPPARRQRQRSASASAFFCIASGCPRAVKPFARRTNLMRHLKLVHHYEDDELPVEVDGEDEMHGAVHVDGFLKPIKMRGNWRDDGGVNAAKEKKRPRTRKRGQEVRVEKESVDQEMIGLDSTAGPEGSD
jgi:hypothetical protein